MRILFLASEFPYPPIGGGKLRVYHLLKELCRHHQVSLITFAKTHETEHLEELHTLGLDSIHLIDGPVRIREPDLSQLFQRLPQFVRTYASPRAGEVVSQVLKEYGFDVIHVEEIVMAANLLAMDSDVPRIIAHQKMDFLYHWRLFRSRQSELGKRRLLLEFLECIKLWFHERKLFRQIPSHVVLAENDREWAIRLAPRTSIVVVPNGVDAEYFSYSDPSISEANRIVFHGSMDYPPNVDAALYFVSEVYPKIIASAGPVELVFVGRKPAPQVVELSNVDGITVTGTVRDIRPFINAASLVVVPIRIGGGIRNKILEAMAMGRPVVSTSVGAEGIRYRNGKNILIADTPSEFSACVVKLLRDTQLAAALALEGRRLVEDDYSWASIAESMSTVYSEAIASQKDSTGPVPN